MKTAISIPDDLYEQAEARAQRLGLNRSQLYRRALERFLEETRAEDDVHPMTAALNEVYGEPAGQTEARREGELGAMLMRRDIERGGWEW